MTPCACKQTSLTTQCQKNGMEWMVGTRRSLRTPTVIVCGLDFWVIFGRACQVRGKVMEVPRPRPHLTHRSLSVTAVAVALARCISGNSTTKKPWTLIGPPFLLTSACFGGAVYYNCLLSLPVVWRGGQAGGGPAWLFSLKTRTARWHTASRNFFDSGAIACQ